MQRAIASTTDGLYSAFHTRSNSTSGEKSSKHKGNSQHFAHLRTKPKEQK